MSRQNVELVQESYAAINHRDLAAYLALMGLEVVAVPLTLGVEGGAVHGHEGIRAWWDGIFNAFPDFNVQVVQIRAIDDVVLACLRIRGHGQGSAAPFEDRVWNVSQIRNGEVCWWKTCRSEAEALGAAELSA